MKNQESPQPNLILFILPLLFFVFLGIMDAVMMIPLGEQIAKSTGLPIEKSGWLISIYPIAAALSAFFLAPFSDRYGRKKVLILLGVGFSLSSFGAGLSDNITMILLFRALAGIFGGVILPNAIAFAGDTFDGKKQSQAVTWILLAIPLASILGVPFAAWCSEIFSWQVVFYVLGALNLITVLILFQFSSVSTGVKQTPLLLQYQEFLSLWKDKRVRTMLAIEFLLVSGVYGLLPNLSAWLSMNYQMTATDIGICFMQGGIGAVLGNLLAGHFLRKGARFQPIVLGSIFMGIFLFLATLEILNVAFLGAFFGLIMFGDASRFPAVHLILTNLLPIHLRGRLMSMNLIVTNIAMGFGGVWSVPLLKIENQKLQGIETIGGIALVLSLLVPFLVYYYQSHEKKTGVATVAV